MKILGTTAGLVGAMAMPVAAQVTSLASVHSSGSQVDGHSSVASISPDGRYVAFESDAYNLVGGDSNGFDDVFVRDRDAGTTDRVSLSSGGAQGNDDSNEAAVSADGRYVAFSSLATNLVAGDTNGRQDVFVRDRLLGTTERVSVDSTGAQANHLSSTPSISADGRYVAFHSFASNLVAGDTNGYFDVYVRDRVAGTTERASLDSAEEQGTAEAVYPSISADGRYVAFHSRSSLVGGDTNGDEDIFVRDRLLGTTERVSVASDEGEGDLYSRYASISADGRYVAFDSEATNLVSGDTNGVSDVFVRDRLLGTTERVSVDSGGAQGNGFSADPSISPDGLSVSFLSAATNFAGGDTNGVGDVYVHDRQSHATEWVSVGVGGAPGNSSSWQAASSADGRFVAFTSPASNLVNQDTNNRGDVFVRDRDATAFDSLCEPGQGGVIACPCSNPPSGPGRGCDNSAATGGASLSAGGIAYLSMDSLVFTTSGERPTALSIVLQGSTPIAAGVPYGQGVRCLGTDLKRLYQKTASGGSITAPDFGLGDPTVSARSAALGNTILAGQSRWYLVYYRDPIVLGGCPATSTFNATQTGQVTWSL